MVCKNCGADLKPGMKYCLNCGNYLDDDDDDNLVEEKEEDIVLDNELDDLPMSYSDNSDNTYVDLDKSDYKDFNSDDNKFKVEVSTSKKKKSLKLSDFIIYGALFLIVIVSVSVLVVSLVKGNKPTNTVIPSTPVKDSVVKCDNYTITFSGELIYNKEGSVIFISDGTNYSLSYKNTVDNFDKYLDMSLLRESLKSSGYNVLYEEKVDVDNNTFLLYKFKDNNAVKYLYLTKLNDTYVTMGVVEPISGGDWKKSLNLINSINKSIKFSENNNNTSDTDSVLNDAATSLYSVIK